MSVALCASHSARRRSPSVYPDGCSGDDVDRAAACPEGCDCPNCIERFTETEEEEKEDVDYVRAA